MNDLMSNVFVFLDGGLGELGFGIFGVDGIVVDSKDVILVFDEEGVVGSNVVILVLFKFLICNRFVGIDVSGLNDYVGWESLVVFEEYGIFVYFSDGGIGVYIYVVFL